MHDLRAEGANAMQALTKQKTMMIGNIFTGAVLKEMNE